MTRAFDMVTTNLSGALAPEGLSTADIAGLQERLRVAAEIVSEIENLDNITSLGKTHPDLACDELLRLAEYHASTPLHLGGLHDAILDLMQRRANDQKVKSASPATEVPSAVRERDRCEEFRANPGRYLEGATTSAIRRIGKHKPVDGFVDFLGVTTPWMYCPMGVGEIAIADASYFIRKSDGAFDAVILVSTHVKEGVEIPTGYMRFVEVR